MANSVPANLKSLPDGIPSVLVTEHRLTQQECEDVDTLTRETRGHNLIAEQLEPGYVQTQALLEKKFPRTAAWTRQQISQGVPAKDAVDSVAKLYGVTGAKGVAYNPAEAAIARSRGEHVVAGGDGKYYYQPSPDKDVDLKIQQNWNKDRANLIGEYAGKNRITNEDVAFNASPIGAVGAATAAVVGKRAGIAVSNAARVAKPGEFSIVEWTGYPSGVPQPNGPFRLLEGAEYNAARDAANSANKTLRKELNLVGKPVDVHEIQPVKFGGNPSNTVNKIILDRSLHRQQVTPWWNALQKELNGK